MLNLNRAQVLGNLTRDPEMRYTPNGQAVCTLGIATNRRWKNRDNDEWQEATEYHDVVVWGKQAEYAGQYFKKGQPIFAEGRIQTRNWEGQDGVKRYKTEIVAESVISMGNRGGASYNADDQTNPVEKISKSKKDQDAEPAQSTPAADATEEIDIEEIPF